MITTATYEARAFGLRSGMALARAAELCPQAVLLPADFDEYRKYSRLFKQAVARIAPAIEDRGIDEIYIDFTPFAQALEQIARALKDAVRAATGLTCSIGVAPNKLLAKIASELLKEIETALAGISEMNSSLAAALRTYYRANNAGDFQTAQSAIGWISAEPNIGRDFKAKAGIRGDVDETFALIFLRALVRIIVNAGYAGLAIAIDELARRSIAADNCVRGCRGHPCPPTISGWPSLRWSLGERPPRWSAARSSATLPVPSGLLSSTTSACRSSGSENKAETNLGRFSASLYVGIMTAIRKKAAPIDYPTGSFWMTNSHTSSPTATHLDSFTRNSLPPESHFRPSCSSPIPMKHTGLSSPLRPQHCGQRWMV